MEEFVQNSKNDGIVVFSLGSMINNITREKADMMATALAQIPQKVNRRIVASAQGLHNQSLNITFLD